MATLAIAAAAGFVRLAPFGSHKPAVVGGRECYVHGPIETPLLLVLFQGRRCTPPPGFSRACVRANSTDIGFHLRGKLR
jgi:hypothetical protein